MDIASNDLKAVTLPIPSEMRIFAFLASGRDREMEQKWSEHGGTTTFQDIDPQDCGICLFRIGAGYVYLIEPFFERAGKEANVFAFCGVRKNFRRVTRDWITTFTKTVAT